MGHIVYMTPSYYKSVYHKTPQNTGMFAIMRDSSEKDEQALGNAFMKKDTIDSVSFYSGIAASFQDTIASLSFIVVVLIYLSRTAGICRTLQSDECQYIGETA